MFRLILNILIAIERFDGNGMTFVKLLISLLTVLFSPPDFTEWRNFRIMKNSTRIRELEL